MSYYVLGGASAVSTSVAVSAAEGSRCFNSSSRTKLKDAVEYDSTPRTCTVYLYTRPTEAMPNNENIEYQHWAIVVEFEDGSWRTAEGLEQDCDIHGFYTKERPEPNENQELHELGKLQSLSPDQLKQHAMDVSINGQPYLIGIRNCQDWAKELASKLGVDIQENINQYGTLKEKKPVQAHVLSLSAASSNTTKRSFQSLHLKKE